MPLARRSLFSRSRAQAGVPPLEQMPVVLLRWSGLPQTSQWQSLDVTLPIAGPPCCNGREVERREVTGLGPRRLAFILPANAVILTVCRMWKRARAHEYPSP